MKKKAENIIDLTFNFSNGEKILIATSGGIDSMVLLDLLMTRKIYIGIAHFNHKTRNGESDLDEEFVKQYALKHKVDFYSTSIDIKKEIKTSKNKNFHDVARKLRYKWLEQIRKDNNYDLIATAHHQDDSIETFLFRIFRGTGSYGLKGIDMIHGKIIRPLINVSKSQIIKYAEYNEINHITDSSNIESKYTRNFIRNEIIPELEKRFPNLKSKITGTIENLKNHNIATDFFKDRYFEKFVITNGGQIKIPISAFTGSPISEQLIYSFISDFGFNFDQAKNINKNLEKVGSTFLSKEYQLLIDRDLLVIEKSSTHDSIHLEINSVGKYAINGFEFEIKIADNDDNINCKSSEFQYLNGDKMEFPLVIRNWMPGDRFCPFGLKGKSKKIKKFLNDRKISKFDKNRALVLLNRDEICAVVGIEIDYRYRIVENTNKAINLNIKKTEAIVKESL